MKPENKITSQPHPVGLLTTIGEFDKYLDQYPPTSNRRPD